jgi:hypothetical protein
MQWGRTVNSVRVHLYINGTRQCFTGLAKGAARPMFEQFPEWDPNDTCTCSRCKERWFWLNKGAVQVPYEHVKRIRTARKTEKG